VLRLHNRKAKEDEFVRRIGTRFPQFQWRFDQRMAGCTGPNGPRPDAIPVNFHADFALDVENDEHSHRRSSCADERRKLEETLQRCGKAQLVVVRFNQDNYVDAHGRLIASCWGHDHHTGQLCIVEKQRAQLNARFEKLFQILAIYLEEGGRPPAEESIFVIELFYDL